MRAWLVLLVPLGGCGRIFFDPLGGASGDGGTTGDGKRFDSKVLGPDASCMPVASCPPASGASVNHTTNASQSANPTTDRGLAGSCGGNPGAEGILQITAQVAGHYSFDIQGATGTLPIYVRDECCTGPELACSPNGTMLGVTVALAQDQRVLVFADGAMVGQLLLIHMVGAP